MSAITGTLTLTMTADIEGTGQKVRDAKADWPAEKKDAFERRLAALEPDDMFVSTKTPNGLELSFSPAFRAFLAEYGVSIK